jgi:integrase
MLGTQKGERAYNTSLCALTTAIAAHETTRGIAPRHIFKRLGMKPADLDDLWVVARGNGQLLDRELVETFFSDAVWIAVGDVISLGPVRAWERAEHVLSCWARGLELDGSKRPRRLSEKTIDLLAACFHRFAKELCELRKLADVGAVDLNPEVLAAWENAQIPAKVTGAKLGASPANTDRRAPSLKAARRALKQTDREVTRRRARSGLRRSMGMALRDRAMLALFLVTGARLGAITRLKRSDFDRYGRSRSGDHVGPVVMLQPGKTLQRHVLRAKFLPEVVGDWIQEWIDYAGINDDPDAPLWPLGKEGTEGLDPQAVYARIRILLDPFVPDRSCSPHTLRHLCEKLAFQAGIQWLDANRQRLLEDENLSGLPSSPQTFADALLDHALSTVQDTYKDINSEPGRETWARIAAEGVWSYVWGENGAPRGPDVERIKTARADVAVAGERRSEMDRELARMKAEKGLLRQRAASDVSLDAKALIQLQFQTDDLADAIADAALELARAEHELDKAQQDLGAAQTAEVALDDDVDLAALDRELEEEKESIEIDLVPFADPLRLFEDRIRDRVTPREFQWALGGEQFVADVTLRRYMRGQLPYPTGDRRNIWDPPSPGQPLPDCILRPSPRKTWILIDKLDLTRLNSHVIERLRYLQTVDEDEVFAKEALAA